MDTLPQGTILQGKSYQYKIVKTLGQGSFGITYLSTVKMAGGLGTIDIDVKVAVKEFFMRDVNGREGTSVTSGSKGGIYDDYKNKFLREAENLGKLQHPNIIKVIESFPANNTIYYAMEFIGGGSLDDYIKTKGRLTEDETVRIAKKIGSALTFMHGKRMLHLDLKPGNVMMRENGEPALIDFGLSKEYDKSGKPETSTTVGRGTPGYAPIEQAQYREGVDFPVTMDVYALGATMFKMLTGKRAPEASDILNYGFPYQELKKYNVSDALIACITKAMEPTKKKRFQTVKDFVTAIDKPTVSKYEDEEEVEVFALDDDDVTVISRGTAKKNDDDSTIMGRRGARQEEKKSSPYSGQKASPYSGQNASPYSGQNSSPYSGQKAYAYSGQKAKYAPATGRGNNSKRNLAIIAGVIGAILLVIFVGSMLSDTDKQEEEVNPTQAASDLLNEAKAKGANWSVDDWKSAYTRMFKIAKPMLSEIYDINRLNENGTLSDEELEKLSEDIEEKYNDLMNKLDKFDDFAKKFPNGKYVSDDEEWGMQMMKELGYPEEFYTDEEDEPAAD